MLVEVSAAHMLPGRQAFDGLSALHVLYSRYMSDSKDAYIHVHVKWSKGCMPNMIADQCSQRRHSDTSKDIAVK